MLGLGEKDEEVLSLLKDLKSNFVDIVTIGQYYLLALIIYLSKDL